MISRSHSFYDMTLTIPQKETAGAYEIQAQQQVQEVKVHFPQAARIFQEHCSTFHFSDGTRFLFRGSAAL